MLPPCETGAVENDPEVWVAMHNNLRECPRVTAASSPHSPDARWCRQTPLSKIQPCWGLRDAARITAFQPREFSTSGKIRKVWQERD